MLGEVKKEFIPKERGLLPRVLLLDFDKGVTDKISQKSKFQVFEGKTGMVDGERLFPRDSSEIEIIFLYIGKWNKKCIYQVGYNIEKNRPNFTVGPEKISPLDTLQISSKDTTRFFSQVMTRGGSIVIFLGDSEPFTDVLLDDFLLSRETNISGLVLFKRYATSLELKPLFDGDFYYKFFDRFVKDKDIKYYINIDAFKQYGLQPYFQDEDSNCYAVVMNKRLIISPKVKDLDKAVLFMLQDVFPFVCVENIYPDLHRFKWLEDKLYTFPEITEQEKKIDVLTKEHNAILSKERESLIGLKDKYSYLQEVLYKDDSDSFEEGKRLKDVVKMVLEDDLGFKDVKDMDKERLAQGLALKEDLVLDGYMFIEVKGTEKGSSPGWVDQLGRHVNQYCAATGTDIVKIKQIVIFNHERRQDPQDRSEPFKNDPTFLASCKRDKIGLIPVFELFKLVKDIKEKKITQEVARDRIRTCENLFKL